MRKERSAKNKNNNIVKSEEKKVEAKRSKGKEGHRTRTKTRITTS